MTISGKVNAWEQDLHVRDEELARKIGKAWERMGKDPGAGKNSKECDREMQSILRSF